MIRNILPSYLYQQYNNDPDLLAFFTAYNTLSQSNLDQTNDLNLPIYTTKSGLMLDWVALGIYGFTRPVLPKGDYLSKGVYNTNELNDLPYNENVTIAPSEFYQTTDDIFKRIITWNFYKGDGYQFTIPWLKRRIERFLNGTNGVSPLISNTYEVSVTFDPIEYDQVNIAIDPTAPNIAYAPIFESALNSGALQFPFGYTFTVTY